MNPAQTALFYFGWCVAVIGAFYVVYHMRRALSAFVAFWKKSIDPFWDRFSGTFLIIGGSATVLGTLLCASSTRWIGITDMKGLACGVVILVIGMAVSIRSSYMN